MAPSLDRRLCRGVGHVHFDAALRRGSRHFVPAGRHVFEALLPGRREPGLQRFRLFGLVAGRRALPVVRRLVGTETDHDHHLFDVLVLGARKVAAEADDTRG